VKGGDMSDNTNDRRQLCNERHDTIEKRQQECDGKFSDLYKKFNCLVEKKLSVRIFGIIFILFFFLSIGGYSWTTIATGKNEAKIVENEKRIIQLDKEKVTKEDLKDLKQDIKGWMDELKREIRNRG
jgi:hypothetical protein